MARSRLKIQTPPSGSLKVWSVKVKDGGPMWTTSPDLVIACAGLDVVSAGGVPKMTPGETMERLWPSWKVECYRVDPEWYEALPEAAKLQE